ncbi:germination protein YpeB [Ferviditalea candida]|uniref:Germination protein YpeB n=1 Tax=Ferviditalea candida TaxID=3108399 RepID=A0ABU5ZJW0_9BACL|nr:germination protein YpeB [Paenibacillaceae bacterium T2]
MYMRLSAILFPIVALALVGAAVWGYQENQEKNSILIKAENQYQRAFHDLTYHVESLHRELGNTLAVNSKSEPFVRKSLANIWRLTSQAQSEINQLPLTLLPFNKTEEFLANIANFSYRTSVRNLTKQPLQDGEIKSLKTLYQRSKDISDELMKVQSQVLKHNLRWMDVEVALASENNTVDNTIIDGFKTVDKKVSAYPEIDWGPSAQSLYRKRTYSAFSGIDMTQEEVKKKAAKLWGLKSSENLKIVENGRGTEYSSYSVSLNQGDQRLQMDFSKKGGNLLWYMRERKVRGQKLTPDQAVSAANRKLKSLGYPQMTPINYDEYDNVASITLAAVKNNVILYPEKLTINVALDNGEALGLNATDYVFEHKERKLPVPRLRLKEAEQYLNGDFRIMSHDLALIRNDENQEVLCYRFTGRINGSKYRIFINADSGLEEKVETIDTAA